MTTTHPTAATSTSIQRPARVWPVAVGAGLLAAGATTALAAVAHAWGVSLDVADEPIVLVAFAQLTFLFAMVGLLIALGIRRWAADPRRTWIATAGVLTVLSFVPDLLADAATSTRLTLMATHLLAAAIVVPAIASRLGRR